MFGRVLQTQLSSFESRRRRDPAFKPVVFGFIWTAAGADARHTLRGWPVPSISRPHRPRARRWSDWRPLTGAAAGGGQPSSWKAKPLREAIDTATPLDLGPDLDIMMSSSSVGTASPATTCAFFNLRAARPGPRFLISSARRPLSLSSARLCADQWWGGDPWST